jgi:hypothetical protein
MRGLKTAADKSSRAPTSSSTPRSSTSTPSSAGDMREGIRPSALGNRQIAQASRRLSDASHNSARDDSNDEEEEVGDDAERQRVFGLSNYAEEIYHRRIKDPRIKLQKLFLDEYCLKAIHKYDKVSNFKYLPYKEYFRWRNEGGIAFVLPTVRQQRKSRRLQLRRPLAFGEDAADIFEPFCRAYIPKLFNESPTIDCLEVFEQLFSNRMERPLRLMIAQEAQTFLRFGDKNSIGRSLYNLYEQFTVNICAMIHSELTNPSFNGFLTYCPFALTNPNVQAFFQPYVIEYKNLMLTAATFCNYDAVDGLVDFPAFKQGKKQLYHEGWFTYFFLCVEEASNRTMSLNVMFDQKKTLDEMVIFFKSFDYRSNQKLVRQPFVLIFAVLNLLNHKYTPVNDSNDSRKPLVPFLSWGNYQTWELHMHPLFIATIELIIFYTCFKGKVSTPGDYRTMLSDPMKEKILHIAEIDLRPFDKNLSITYKEAMIMCQVTIYLFQYVYNIILT